MGSRLFWFRFSEYNASCHAINDKYGHHASPANPSYSQSTPDHCIFTPPQVPARLRLQIPDLALPPGTEGAAHVYLPPVLRNTELVLSPRP